MIVKGPFNLIWGEVEVQNVEEIEVEYEVDTQEIQTVQGRTIEVEGAHKASVSLTLVDTDVSALYLLLPHYHVQNGGLMSTGETVNEAYGAMDLVPSRCGEYGDYANLDIQSCEDVSHVMRLVNARTTMSEITFEDNVRKITVRFIGESLPGQATIQLFKEGTISVVS